MLDKDDLAWYLIYTKPQQERVARDNLDRQNFHTYLALVRKRIRRGRQFHHRIEPLFPRYLFIRLSESTDDWGPIRSTIGVANLVRFGDKPASIPDALVLALKAHEGDEGVHELPAQELKAGERVRFVEGTLSGYEAIFETRTSSERVIVLMDIAGKHSRLSVSEAAIEVIPPS